MADLSTVPPASHFHFGAVSKYVVGPQPLQKGRLMVAAGMIYQLCKEGPGEFSAYVLSEVHSGQYYRVRVKFSGVGIGSSDCVCAGSSHVHHKCKHISAILLTILAAKHHRDNRPEWAQRPGMYRLRGLPADDPFVESVRPHMAWEEVLANLGSEPPKQSGKRMLVDAPIPRSKKASKKTYCYCRKPYDDDRDMVQCGECKDWFHEDCLRKMGQRVAIAELGKSEFICRSCAPPKSKPNKSRKASK